MNNTYELLVEKIDNYILEHKEEIIADLRTLVRIPSVRDVEQKGMPFGKACYDILNASLKIMHREGFDGKFAVGNEYVVATNGESEKTIGIFAHGDVVSAEGEWFFGEPFELTERNGFLIGRGCNDDKSGIIQMIYASKIIKELQIPMKSGILLYVGACEEDGMDDIREYVKNEKMPDVSIVPDGGYPYYKGEKSRVGIMLESVASLENIEELRGGKNYNVILETLNVTYKDGATETVKGIGGAVSNPVGKANALKIFASNAEMNSRLSDSDKKIMKSICEILGEGYGKEIGIEHSDEVFGPLTCGNGIVKTQDEKLLISLDIRHSTSVESVGIVKKIEEKLKGSWNIVSVSKLKGYLIEDNDRYAQAITDAYKLAAGIEGKCEAEVISGGTYSKFLENSYSVGTVMYNVGGKMNAPEGHGEYHQPDESMSIVGFLESIKTLVLMILKLDEILQLEVDSE